MVAGLKKKWGWEEKRVAVRSKGTGTGWVTLSIRSNLVSVVAANQILSDLNNEDSATKPQKWCLKVKSFTPD